MGTIDISYFNLTIGLLLALIPVYFLWKFKTGLVRATLVGILRMTVQLLFVGMYLKYMFEWNSPWIKLAWAIVMVLVASQTALTRTNLKREVIFIPITIGFLTGVLTIGLYFLAVVLRITDVFNAQYFIPIFGILMGNMLSSNVIALNAYYSSIIREQQLYYYYLGNGASLTEARAPFIGEAMKKAFSPLIANMAVMGLVALPGTLIGQILGGSSPNVAIKYQIMIIVINFTASMLSLVITIRLSSRKSFDKSGVLKPVFKDLK